MANAFYSRYRKRQLDKASDAVAWLTDNIKAVLIDTGQYTVDLDAHEYLSDIASGARLATSANLTNKTDVNGVADADDAVFSSLPNTSYEAVVLYKDTGTASTSVLMVYLDTGTGMSGLQNGGSVNLVWSASGIFKF